MTTMTTQSPQSQSLDAPVLSDEQVGHIRHIGNLARLPRGDWRHMAGPLPLQEDFSAYRYQLGYMSLAMGLAHYHRLPAAPAVFRGTLDRLIQRMLEPDVWWYWRDTSMAGGFGPFTLPKLPSRTDPVGVDNIMYSAYLQVMTLQYTMLFDDRKYEEPGSLTFRVQPFLWGGDSQETFRYDQRTLTERIYWNLVQNGFLGVACEPLCVFQLCNQIPILGYRLHDHIYGGDLAREATEGYLRAWADFGGGVNERGHFIKFIVQRNELQEKDVPSDADSAYGDAWLGMLMNMWRPELVRRTYRDKVEKWLDRAPGGTIAVKDLGRLPGSEELVEPGTLSEMGWLAGWASEMGDEDVVSGLLRHADSFMNPQWEKGGLYYPRCDDSYDSYGRFVNMTPTVSNAMLPYARLNVGDGLRTLFERPWTDRERSRPALTEIGEQIDVRRAWYHEDSRTLQLTVSPMHGLTNATAELTVSAVWSDDWSLVVDGVPVARGVDGAVVATEIGQQLAPRRRGDALDLSLPLGHGGRDLEMVWGRA